jgi:sterol 3beta-glucosyltransferase
MRIAVVSLGSRGDVQPFVALAGALANHGHDIRLVTHANFAELAAGRGIAFEAVSGNFQAILSGAPGLQMTASGRNPLQALRAMREIDFRYGRKWWTQLRDLSADAEFLVTATTSFGIVASLAEYRNVPWIYGCLAPLIPTRALPSPLLPAPAIRLPGWANLLHQHAGRQLLWQVFRHSIDAARRDVLGLQAWPLAGPFTRFNRERHPTLLAFSEHVIPRPADWGDHLEVTGYWFLERPANWAPPEGLARFLEAGPAPVYIGFGSMVAGDPRTIGAILFDALVHAGCRAVINAGWAGLHLERKNNDIYIADELPHDWLFPRMAAVVHHCGAGTTASALRAGVPSVPVPFMADQFFWAWRLHQLGVAPAAVPRRKLTSHLLATALRRVLDDQEIRRRAQNLGELIRAERGLSSAVGAIERQMEKQP